MEKDKGMIMRSPLLTKIYFNKFSPIFMCTRFPFGIQEDMFKSQYGITYVEFQVGSITKTFSETIISERYI